MEAAKLTTIVRRAEPARPAPALQRRAASLVTPGVQASLRISSPSDPAEREAESTAKQVVAMSIPEASIAYLPTRSGGGVFRQMTGRAEREKEMRRGWQSPYVSRFAGSIQRKFEGRPDTGANVAAEIQTAKAAGKPLPLSVRRFMEPRFRADFSNVRMHTGDRSAALNRQVAARAFAVENQIFFGKDQFRPESDTGRELIAHELTHTIQQGSAIQRSEAVTITQSSPVQVQRGIFEEALDLVAEKAANIPGFTMLTVVVGMNPVNMTKVDRSPANVFRAIVGLIPFGEQISKALIEYGVFDKVATWAEQQIRKVGASGTAIYNAVVAFAKGVGLADIAQPTATWNRAKAIFTDPIDRIIDTAKGLATGILTLLKEAILIPLARLAQKLPSYDLLRAVMEKDPVTGDPYPRTPETVIGGFMKLAGQTDVWTRMQETKAVPKAWAWFQKALKDVVGFVKEIPALFVKAVTSLGIADVILLPRAFGKVVGVFGGFVGRFTSWAGTTVWSLLEIIFDVVKPGAMSYVKRTGAALKSILKNPLPFVGNLARAAKLGFQNFAGRFLGHLKTGLIDWLTGSLPGIYIPKAFTLPELVKFVFSVLGISWANIRGKLVKVVGEPAVAAMETGFDIVKTLVTQGPASAWEKIKEQLAQLQEMVIGGITDLVVDAVVKKAVPKVVAMFIPGAGFVSAIVSIYDMVMTFVQKISKIVAVVTAFVDSIVAIAAGQIGAAAARVEKILAGLLSLAISFLAGFAGLGKISDKIMGVINKIRATIDKALDWLINWIVTMAKKLFSKVFGSKDKDGETEKSKAVKAKVRADLVGKTITDAAQAEALVASVYSRFSPEGLKGIRVVYDPASPGTAKIRVNASAAEVVADLPLTSEKDVLALKDYATTFHFLAGGTRLFVYYDEGSRTYGGSPIRNKSKKFHAEMVFAQSHIGALRAEIAAHRAAGTLKTPPGKKVRVDLNLNRITCPLCAPIIGSLAAENPDMTFVVKAANVSNDASFEVYADYIAGLIEKGVIVEPLGIWPEIQKKFLEFQRKFAKGEIAFKGDSDNFEEVVAAARTIQENLAKEQGVKDLIEAAKKRLERKKQKQATTTALPKVAKGSPT